MTNNTTTRTNDVDTITREHVARIDAFNAMIDDECASHAFIARAIDHDDMTHIDALIASHDDARARTTTHNVANTTRANTTRNVAIDANDCVVITRSLTKNERAILRRVFAQHAIDTHAHRASWRNASIPRAIASLINM